MVGVVLVVVVLLSTAVVIVVIRRVEQKGPAVARAERGCLREGPGRGAVVVCACAVLALLLLEQVQARAPRSLLLLGFMLLLRIRLLLRRRLLLPPPTLLRGRRPRRVVLPLRRPAVGKGRFLAATLHQELAAPGPCQVRDAQRVLEAVVRCAGEDLMVVF